LFTFCTVAIDRTNTSTTETDFQIRRSNFITDKKTPTAKREKNHYISATTQNAREPRARALNAKSIFTRA
jgi:hypothetical protein